MFFLLTKYYGGILLLVESRGIIYENRKIKKVLEC